jgi:DNA gyrase subunit A
MSLLPPPEQERPSFAREIIPMRIEDEMRVSYTRYAMSVIVGRALPDVRDGLKPVHRRILYAMFDQNMTPDRRREKCASAVGEVLKKYHPHGDQSVYDALVRMAQDFSMRHPLVDGQGNFGSVDGDAAAAYRYTEARLAPLSMELMRDIDMETVDFGPNFSESTTEPTVMPSVYPNLLVNGSSGIAVGMATNIPPHNLGEVCDAVAHVIDNPDASAEDLQKIMPGPDFPTAGIILGTKGITSAYATGRGSVIMQARATIEPFDNGRNAIIITELPYQVNKATLVENIADMAREKRIEGISDLRDESDRQGMRIVIELRRDANANVVLNTLYKHTALRTSFGVNCLAIVGGQPKILSLKNVLDEFIKHREDVIKRRSQFQLRKAEARAHILEGFRAILASIDDVIALIRSSQSREDARNRLMNEGVPAYADGKKTGNVVTLSEIQANAVLDMRLGQLTQLDRMKIDDEYAELIKEIERFAWHFGIGRKVRSSLKPTWRASKRNTATRAAPRFTTRKSAASTPKTSSPTRKLSSPSRATATSKSCPKTPTPSRIAAGAAKSASPRRKRIRSSISSPALPTISCSFSPIGPRFPTQAYEVPDGKSHFQGHADCADAASRARRSGDGSSQRFELRRRALSLYGDARRHRQENGAFGLREPSHRRPDCY